MTSKYPRWIPNPATSNGQPELLVKDEADHMLKNEKDYEAFLNEKPASPASVQEQVDAAVASERAANGNAVTEAVAAERERCAAIAVAYGGKQAASIAADIRGFKPEASAEAGEANQG